LGGGGVFVDFGGAGGFVEADGAELAVWFGKDLASDFADSVGAFVEFGC
jgi:hypothetical protein